MKADTGLVRRQRIRGRLQFRQIRQGCPSKELSAMFRQMQIVERRHASHLASPRATSAFARRHSSGWPSLSTSSRAAISRR